MTLSAGESIYAITVTRDRVSHAKRKEYIFKISVALNNL